MVVIMVGIFISVLTPILHRMNHGRLAYLEEIFDFPSTYLNYMACSLPSVSPPTRAPGPDPRRVARISEWKVRY